MSKNQIEASGMLGNPRAKRFKPRNQHVDTLRWRARRNGRSTTNEVSRIFSARRAASINIGAR
ncbi:hypothetical protein BJX62DRAFT_212442 [Aspergillus germanicus]